MHGFLARIMSVGLLVPLGFAIVGATPGFAQMGGTGMQGVNNAVQKNLKAAQQGTKPDVQPPVLPGTKGASEPAEPTVSAANMSPTEGLFDAINRGDITAARDTINRGANLDGQNLLGLTPLELSVDLGRNDITFLLLSMRGDDHGLRRNPLKDAEQPIVGTSKTMGRAHVVATSSPGFNEPATTLRLYSRNGGAPIPAAGFLGFDEGRQVP